jgi:probable phosphoglycerate mutase
MKSEGPSKPSAELILIRHGETEWNAVGRYMNQLDSRLSSLGIDHAEKLAKRLVTIEFSSLYCSDQGRAIATATHIARTTGKEILIRPGLREQSLGVFAGHTRAEIEQRFSAELAQSRQDPNYAVPGGESSLAFHERVKECLQSLADHHSGERVVAVTHGGVLAAALRTVMALGPVAPCPASQLNASLNVFLIGSDGWKLKTWGDVAHL